MAHVIASRLVEYCMHVINYAASVRVVSRGQTLDGKVRVWSTAHIGLVLTPTPVGVGDKYVRTTAFTTHRVYYKALRKQSRYCSETVYLTPYNKRDVL